MPRPPQPATLARARISLATGAANARALAFYARHGYQPEDVRLSKSLAENVSDTVISSQ